MRNKYLKLRYPDLNFIIYAGIICLIVPFFSLPIILISPDNDGLRLDFLSFTLGALFIGGFFFLLFLVPALFFLNFFWRRFIFDESRNKIVIIRHFLFFPIGKREEVDFYDASLNIESEFMLSSLRGVQGSGRVWVLTLNTSRGNYNLGYSLIKKRLESKKSRIEQILKA